MIDDRPIRVVLDATAVSAYCKGSIDVGEILGEVSDEAAVVALPVLCVVEAWPAVADIHLLDVLLTHRHTRVLGLEPTEWERLSAAYDATDRLDVASTVVASDGNGGAAILTAAPDLYASFSDNGTVIPISPN
ncbi:hypothetical protein [Catenuloplanes atrovinosus]|uniref:PIN domain-containing protein n=1 Tax=Catenuloplanes atrovinosus TaxID=137266 RepID=A0AAE3YXG0_9ACTN|nr:hypothetical protein [Catenuloplanes atrovinosus]MDR7280972.1 hypothetical protein [Catenuloplanes atrovinosus]